MPTRPSAPYPKPTTDDARTSSRPFGRLPANETESDLAIVGRVIENTVFASPLKGDLWIGFGTEDNHAQCRFLFWRHMTFLVIDQQVLLRQCLNSNTARLQQPLKAVPVLVGPF